MNIRNKTIPGRLKPAQFIIFAIADEATALAMQVEGMPWRRLALRAAILAGRAKRKKMAAHYLERVKFFMEKSKGQDRENE